MMRKWMAFMGIAVAFPIAQFAHAEGPVSVATGSISVTESFTGATLSEPGKWISMTGGTLRPQEWPCLTAATVATTTDDGLVAGTVEACVNQNGTAVTPGDGALRLTRRRALNNPYLDSGSLLYNDPLNASEGIDISFSVRTESGQVADGMSFFLKDGDQNISNVIGTAGGAMGYGMSHVWVNSATPLGAMNGNGLHGALLGIGFDRYGNFSWDAVGSADCPDRGTHNNAGSPPSEAKNMLVLRGPDTSQLQDGTAGYCYLKGSTVTYADSAFQRVRVKVDPYLPGTATTVSVYLAPANDPTTLPQNPTLTESITISATTFKFGFSAATGWWSNNHDIRGLSVSGAGSAQWWPVASMVTDAPTGAGTGPTSGGTVLTINGSNINANATVTIDGEPCTNVTVAGDGTSLTCLTPSRSLGTKQVIVANPGGLPGYGTFTYVNPTPTVTSVDPSRGTPDGGNTVTIIGTGFVDGATATLGGQPCTSVVVVSSTSLTCTAPSGTDGSVVDAVVTNIGDLSGTGLQLYTYTNVPVPVQDSTTTTVAQVAEAATSTDSAANRPAPSPRPGVLPSTGVTTLSFVVFATFTLLLAVSVLLIRRRLLTR